MNKLLLSLGGAAICFAAYHMTATDVGSSATSLRPITLGQTPAAKVDRVSPEWSQTSTYTASGPSVIQLSDVPVGARVSTSKIDRNWGMNGPRRMPSRISEAEADRLRAAAANMGPSTQVYNLDTFRQARLAPLAAGVDFDSLDYDDCCGGGGNVPPDPELAVGPNHIIAVVNVAFEIYDKSGTLLQGPTTFESFFTGTPGCSFTNVFDPNVLYDEENDRFILGIDGDGVDYCVAAAQTSDPLGAWNRYGFVTDIGGAFFDYPQAGVGVEAIFVGSNQFGGTAGFEGRLFAIDRAALIAGDATLTVVTQSTGDDSTPQPMNLHGAAQGTFPTSGPHYILTEVFDGINHTVWSWTDPFGANILSRDGDLDLQASTGVTAGFPLDQPQAGPTGPLLNDIQANDWRGLDTEYRDGNIWMTNTISCNPGSGSVNCIRWAKIDPTIPAILDSGVFSSDGEYRSFPDLAVNACEDMAVGYTKTSTTTFPSVYVTGREATDAPGTVQPETLLKAGETTYDAFDGAPHRWGDYTGMTIDPDGQTFWYLGQYSKDTGNPNGNWGTYVGSFTYPSCAGEEGDISGQVDGLALGYVECLNRDTPNGVPVIGSGSSAWNCTDNGFEAVSGDFLRKNIVGRADGSEPLISGSVDGMTLQQVICRNDDLDINFGANLSGDTWTCELEFDPGNLILQILYGTAD